MARSQFVPYLTGTCGDLFVNSRIWHALTFGMVGCFLTLAGCNLNQVKLDWSAAQPYMLRKPALNLGGPELCVMYAGPRFILHFMRLTTTMIQSDVILKFGRNKKKTSFMVCSAPGLFSI